MMKRLSIFIILSMLFVACSSNGKDQSSTSLTEEQELKLLHVEILTAEDAFEPGIEGKIEIEVTVGDEPVPDADEVLFEIWEHGSQEDSEKILGEHEKDGIYSLTYTFEKEGVYYVVPHVTARGQHNMPKQIFLVGDVEKPVEQEESNHHH